MEKFNIHDDVHCNQMREQMNEMKCAELEEYRDKYYPDMKLTLCKEIWEEKQSKRDDNDNSDDSPRSQRSEG